MSDPRPRPPHVTAPAHWTNEPLPEPEPMVVEPEIGGRKDGLEPTRYGDWESKGMAIDF